MSMEWTQARHLLDDFDLSTRAEFSELVPEHRSVECKLSSSGFIL
jgi:hypothetical protein